MDHITHLKCLLCGKEYAPDSIDYICPCHGNEGIVDVCYDYAAIGKQISRESLAANRDQSIWRYTPLLPIAAHADVPPLAIGWTPLYPAPRLADTLALQKLWVKDDGRLPTGSLKDRASAIAVVKAAEKGAEIICTASTGNAAAALSGICASTGQKNVIFVPESAPEAKIAQLLVYDSTVMLVRGSYDDAFELCLEAAAEYGWYNRNTGYNPYMTEGKKTVAYEICEQLNWDAPDVIVVSVGDGCIIGGLHKGLKDLMAMGWIEHMPRLIGVQAEGSNFMYEAWRDGEDILSKAPVSGITVADSISAGLPRDRIKALAAVTETDGAFVVASDGAILDAIPTMARRCGVFGEPAGAAAYAGLELAVATGLVQAHERTVVLNTGNGLKDIRGSMNAVARAGSLVHRIEPNLAALKKIVKERI
jgi:threonine synthase